MLLSFIRCFIFFLAFASVSPFELAFCLWAHLCVAVPLPSLEIWHLHQVSLVPHFSDTLFPLLRLWHPPLGHLSCVSTPLVDGTDFFLAQPCIMAFEWNRSGREEEDELFFSISSFNASSRSSLIHSKSFWAPILCWILSWSSRWKDASHSCPLWECEI